MVRKIFGFLYQETNSLNQAALLLGLFAFLSQLLAFLRDRLLAHIFGAGAELDIYYAAFRIPDFLFVTVASIVSISVLIPFIVEKETLGREVLREMINSIFTFFGLLMFVVAAVSYVYMPWLSHILFKGMPESQIVEIIFLSRVLLLSPILLGLSNLFGSLTQAYNRFTIYALAPILYNAGIVVGIIVFGEKWGILGVVAGVIFGAALHLVVQVPFVMKSGLLPKVTTKVDWPLLYRVVTTSLPRTLTLSMSSIVLIFLVSFASRMVEGSISVLSFATNMQSVPLALIGVSYSLAAFPTLTRKFQEKNIDAFVEQMQNTSRFIIFWSLPLTALFVVLRAQVVRVLLGSGLFDWSATRLTAAAVALFTLSAVFQSLLLLFMRGFYSAGFTRKPFFINLFSTGVLVVTTYGLVKWFYASEAFRLFISSMMKVEDLPGSVVLMLPLGFTLGMIVNGVLLWVFFEREFKGFSRGVTRTLFEGLGASFIMGLVAYVGLQVFAGFFDLDTLPGIFLQGLFSGLLAIISGAVVLIALKSQELKSVWQVLRGKFWRAEVIASDPEIV